MRLQLSDEIHQIALDAQGNCDGYTDWEGDAIARAVLDHVVSKLTDFATEEFTSHGAGSARGAALWDAARFVDEKLIGDLLERQR